VAVGVSGSILTSSDATTWTSRTSGTTVGFTGFDYGNSIFVAVGYSGLILTSTDGITWTSRTSGTSIQLTGVDYKE
jgi:hypothetical protein